MNLSLLPEELQMEIIIFLSHRDLYLVAVLSKWFCKIIEKDSFWRRFTVKKLGDIGIPNDGNWKQFFKDKKEMLVLNYHSTMFELLASIAYLQYTAKNKMTGEKVVVTKTKVKRWWDKRNVPENSISWN